MFEIYLYTSVSLHDNIINKLSSITKVKGYILSDKNECLKENLNDTFNIIKLCDINSILPSIILCSEDSFYEDILRQRYDSTLVVNYSLFSGTTFFYPGQFYKQDKERTGIILGMSHAQNGIDEKLISNGHDLNFSSPSMDLFCHYKYLEKYFSNNKDEAQKLERIIIEIPYYIFNYDLSMFGNFTYTKLEYFFQLGDFHNFSRINNLVCCQYSIYRNLVNHEESYSQELSLKQKILSKIGVYFLVDLFKAVNNKDKVWRRVYKDTINENKLIWTKIISLKNTYCPNSKVIVVVMPFNPAFRLFNSKWIKMQKSIFYDEISITNEVRVIDNFNYFSNPVYFRDHCHLTERAKKIYSEHLNSLLNQD